MPPGDEAHDGAIRIFGVINVLSERRRFGNAFETRKKLLSGDDGEFPNHQAPIDVEPVQTRYIPEIEIGKSSFVVVGIFFEERLLERKKKTRS